MKPFEKRVWLSSPTMHGDELKYMTEAYDTNWISTIGANIQAVEQIAAEKAGMRYAVALSNCTAALHLCVKAAGERLYGRPAVGHGTLDGKRVHCFRLDGPVFDQQYQIPFGQYALHLESDVPVVAVFGRLDTRQPNLAYYAVQGYSF